jgi:putative transposase
MIRLEDRTVLAQNIDTAHSAGARLGQACAEVGITVRKLQRWKADNGFVSGERRPTATRPVPAHALSAEEREPLLRMANEPRFADERVFLASESSFRRVSRAHGQSRHRGRAKAPRPQRAPTTHVASAPRQLSCWDMTYLPTEIAGRCLYLYLILDAFSRKIEGFEVHDTDDSQHATNLVKPTALAEGIHAMKARSSSLTYLRKPRSGRSPQWKNRWGKKNSESVTWLCMTENQNQHQRCNVSMAIA